MRRTKKKVNKPPSPPQTSCGGSLCALKEKLGNFKEAEKYYMEGLVIDPNHNGINEYLGELYVKTGRIELAKERLAVLANCNCEEYEELKEVIEKN